VKRAQKYLAFSLHGVGVSWICLLLTGCSGGGDADFASGDRTLSPKRATSRPYVINGISYYPQQHYEYKERGLASYYGGRDSFHGKKTSTAEIFNAHGLTAAHKTLPLPSVVVVTNLDNGRSLKLKVNDRGPFIDGRIIDVSEKASRLLGFYRKGTANVQVECLVMESLILAQNPRGELSLQLAQVQSDSNYSNGYKPQHMMSIQALQPKQPQASNSSILMAQANIKYHHPVKPLLRPPLPQMKPATVRQQHPSSHHRNVPQGYMAYAHAPSTLSLPVKTVAQKVENIFIQAGTFSLFTNAQNLSRQLKASIPHISIDLKAVLVRNASMFAVRLGPFRNSDEAQNLLKQMARAGHRDARVIRD
jgi:rare lipoprotein A